MAPGKRKSPFIGAVDTAEDPILYQRYNDRSDVLLEPKKKKKKRGPTGSESKVVAEKTTVNGSAALSEKPQEDLTREELLCLVQAQRDETDLPDQKAGKQRSVQKASPNAHVGQEVESLGNVRSSGATESELSQAVPIIEEAGKKKQQKGKKRKSESTSKAPSGPGNAAEAERIRSVMGIKKGESIPAKLDNGFSFGFQAEASASKSSEPEENDSSAESERQENHADNAATDPGKVQKREANGDANQADKAEPQSVQELNGSSHLDAKLKRVLGQKSEHVARRVFVGGMPFTYDEDEVRDYWSYCGEIEDLDLMRFPDTGRFKGIAFVTFADEAGYKQALKCNGEYIDEHKLKVEPCMSAGPKSNGRQKKADRSSQKSQFSSPAPKTPGYHVAYVGNLAFEANQKQLKEVLGGCNVTIIRLHTDKDTGKSKGYAHVHFADEESLDRAIKANGQKLLGRPIRVGYAQPKKE